MPELYGADGQVIRRFHYDHSEKRAVIEYRQDVEQIVERNKTRQTQTQRGDMRFLAEVPFTMIYRWLASDGIEFRRWMKMPGAERRSWLKRHLNDADNKFLRSVPGRI